MGVKAVVMGRGILREWGSGWKDAGYLVVRKVEWKRGEVEEKFER